MKLRAILLAAALFAVTASPLPAKQRSAVDTDSVRVSAPTTQPSGPRVRDEMRRVEPTLGTSPEPAVRHRSTETITISTLVLVLLVVLVVLLVV